MWPCSLPSPGSGANRIFGTVSFSGTPDAPAVGALVLLRTADLAGGVPALSSQADTAGGFVFDGVASTMLSLVVAFDPANQYDPVCKNKLIPSPMPPDPAEH